MVSTPAAWQLRGRPGLQLALSQLQSMSAVMALAFSLGLAIGWTSPALRKLSSGAGPFVPTVDELTWIASLFDLGALAGCLLSTAVFSCAGRRPTVLLGPAALLLWSLLTCLARTPGLLMAARLVGGVGYGVGLIYSFIYVAEVASARLRGSLVISLALLQPLGQLTAYSYGPYVSFRTQALAPLPVLLLVFVLAGLWMRETPFFLAMRGRHDDVLETLRTLRRGVDEEDVRGEADAIRASVQRQMQSTTLRETFAAPGALRSTLLVMVISSSFALLGVTCVLTYTTQIFEASGTPIDADVSSVVVMCFKVAMVAVAMVLIERLGRRMQLAVTSIGNAIAMTGMCVFFVARDVWGVDMSSASWIPLALMLMYVTCAGLGVNCVPQVLLSELLSERLKMVLPPFIVMVSSVLSLAANKMFLVLGHSPGFYLPFGFFACTNLTFALFTLFLLPETRGKSLVEVQEMLRRGDKAPLSPLGPLPM